MSVSDVTAAGNVPVIARGLPLIVDGVLHPALEAYDRFFGACRGSCFFCEKGQRAAVGDNRYVCMECKRLQPSVVECFACKTRMATTCFFGKSTEDLLRDDNIVFCSDVCAQTPFNVKIIMIGTEFMRPVTYNTTIGQVFTAWLGGPLNPVESAIVVGASEVVDMSLPLRSFGRDVIISVVARTQITARSLKISLPKPAAAAVVDVPAPVMAAAAVRSIIPVPDPEGLRRTNTQVDLLTWFVSRGANDQANDPKRLFGMPTDYTLRKSSEPLLDGTGMYAFCIHLDENTNELDRLLAAGFDRTFVSPPYYHRQTKRDHYYAIVHSGESRPVMEEEMRLLEHVSVVRAGVSVMERPTFFFEKVVGIQRRFYGGGGAMPVAQMVRAETNVAVAEEPAEKKQRGTRNVEKSGPAVAYLMANASYSRGDAFKVIKRFKRKNNAQWSAFQTFGKYPSVLVCVHRSVRQMFESNGYAGTVMFTPEIYKQEECVLIVQSPNPTDAARRLEPFFTDGNMSSFMLEVISIQSGETPSRRDAGSPMMQFSEFDLESLANVSFGL